MDIFKGSFTQQEPLPDEAIAAAMQVLGHGRLHRYNVVAGEIAEAALLEQEFAQLTGAKYCLALASGGAAMRIALRAIGVGAGDLVLSNGFTLAPVPGAIAAVGARAVFVEVTPDLTIDLVDLAQKIHASSAKTLLLSHMRGHMCDMDQLMALCGAHGVRVIEDCAHTMGAHWGGAPSGRYGLMGCYSTQTYKHINSGEGGLLISDDDQAMARAILLSGSYMLYERHLAAPEPEVFEGLKLDTPNMSSRMDNLRASILRPQLPLLAERVARWRSLYDTMAVSLKNTRGLRLTQRGASEAFVGSSFQFLMPEWGALHAQTLVARAAKRGVDLKWFGADSPIGFTSRYDHWRFAAGKALPETDQILKSLFDMRLPLTFTPADCVLIAKILHAEIQSINQAGPDADGTLLSVD
jgi:dTDP-4-amino-4,6-dideoxygalactose transaminase